MSKDSNLDLNPIARRREELEVALNWKIIPELDQETEYRITIAYHTNSSKQENIKILGCYKGKVISEKVLKFFDKFLTDADGFGMLAETRTKDEVKNWDISFSRNK